MQIKLKLCSICDHHRGGDVYSLQLYLTSPSVQTRRVATLVLSCLVYRNLENGVAIREAQGIPALIALLQTTDIETKRYATAALDNLATWAEANSTPETFAMFTEKGIKADPDETAAIAYLKARLGAHRSRDCDSMLMTPIIHAVLMELIYSDDPDINTHAMSLNRILVAYQVRMPIINAPVLSAQPEESDGGRDDVDSSHIVFF